MPGGPSGRDPLSMAAISAPATDESFSLGGLSARRVALMGAMAALMVVSAVLLAPAIADLPDAWRRLTNGDPRWLAFALGLEAMSFLGHAILLRAVTGDTDGRIGLRASTEITLAGHAATRLFDSAGAGGILLTAWALRRSGMDRAEVTRRMTTFMVLLYGVYMVALLAGGLGLATGILHGGGSLAITLIPAALGGAVIAIALAAQWLRPPHRLAAVGQGVRDALRLIRTGNLGLLGAIMWWAFDIAVLWAAFRAFGVAPPIAIVVVAYFVGTLANTLPLPGGVGGVEGGIIGAFVAFGVDPGTALVAVLAYRVYAFWLPIVPGVIAYLTLRKTVARWSVSPSGHARARPAGDDTLAGWKASEASSTTPISSGDSRRWPSRCRVPSPSPGLTTPSSSLST